jgi:hypothetical protein
MAEQATKLMRKNAALSFAQAFARVYGDGKNRGLVDMDKRAHFAKFAAG